MMVITRNSLSSKKLKNLNYRYLMGYGFTVIIPIMIHKYNSNNIIKTMIILHYQLRLTTLTLQRYHGLR
jgi:hypothetical protein